MGYGEFLCALFEAGRLTVPEPAGMSASEIQAGDAELVAFEARYRLEMPGEPPALVLPAARWAGVKFYRACQFTVFRDVDEATLTAELQTNYAALATAGVHYSVDLVFRFLPDLLKLARGLSERDPLVAQLMHWARAWPLSSVGIAEMGEVVIDGFADEPSLLTLYIDRIFATGDKTRLADSRAREAAQAAVGIYPAIAGSLAPHLKPEKILEEMA